MTRFTHYHWCRSSEPKQVDDPRHSSHSMLFLYFAEQFWVCSKTEQKVEFPDTGCAWHIHNPDPTVKIPHSDDTFVTVHEPTSLLLRIRRATCLYLLDPTVYYQWNPYLLKVVCAGHLQLKASSFTSESTPSSRLTSTILLSPTLHSGFTFLFNHSWILFR